MFNLGDMMGRLKQMQADIGGLRERLEQIRVTERVGGVSATVTGNKRLLDVQIAPELLAEPERLHDELVSAVNRALDAAEARGRDEMAQITQGLPNIPGLDLPR